MYDCNNRKKDSSLMGLMVIKRIYKEMMAAERP
jgi:hypothetical protein